MSASARAEARRKAILSRGGERLSKLTTSARGEDAGSYIDTSTIRSTSGTFLGEESNDMPIPKPFTPSPTPSPQPTRKTSLGSTSTSASNTSASTSTSTATQTPSKPRSSVTSGTSHPHEAAGLGGRLPTPDPSVWSPEQQQQFMQALMAASSPSNGNNSTLQTPLGGNGEYNDPVDPRLPPLDNPLAAMLFGGLQGGSGGPGGPFGGGPFGGMGAPGQEGQNPFGFPPGLMNLAQANQGGGNPFGPPPVEVEKPKTRLQKLMPVVHVLAVWGLLAYFVFFQEPRVYSESSGSLIGGGSVWERWGRLLKESPAEGVVGKVFSVLNVPFFWAFLTVEIALHSAWIFSKSDAIRPPTLVALALPHLPPPLPSIIVNSLKYIRMISAILDDIAALIVGLGFIVYLSSFLSN